MTRLFNGNVNLDNARSSMHVREDRKARMNLVQSLDSHPVIDRAFVVDKGHRNGKEIHCVSENGIIYVLNLRKYLKGYNSLVTAMVARPKQVTRLYESCNLVASENIISKCRKHQQLGFNMI